MAKILIVEDDETKRIPIEKEKPALKKTRAVENMPNGADQIMTIGRYDVLRKLGVTNSSLSYFVISVAVFMAVYLLYFAATYLGFKRNVEEVFVRLE